LPGGLLSSGPISIGGYTYSAGDFRLPGSLGRPALVERGDQLTFQLAAGDQATETWHSVTSCKSPCNRSTGISYPIADGEIQFDSGQLGVGGAPTVNRTTWSTPPDLPLGTYTFFCRIHPLMRGALRVVKPE
jgi:plastocyanin